MRAPTILTLAAVAAALATAVGAQDRRLALYRKMASCCKTTKMLAYLFKKDGISCAASHLSAKVSNFFTAFTADPHLISTEIINGCLVECIFKGNGFIKEDDSVDRAKLEKVFLERAEKEDADVKPVVRATLTKCFAVHNQITEKIADQNAVCKSGSHLLIACILREVLFNCPDSAWKDDKTKCKDKKDQIKRDATAAEKEELTAAVESAAQAPAAAENAAQPPAAAENAVKPPAAAENAAQPPAAAENAVKPPAAAENAAQPPAAAENAAQPPAAAENAAQPPAAAENAQPAS